MPDRPIPNPSILATRPATPPPPAPRRRPAFDRRAWEAAVLDSHLHFTVRLTGLALAHYALDGHLPAGGVQHTVQMAERTGLSPEKVRTCLRGLEKAGLITRPPAATWVPKDKPRPITLTLPTTPATIPAA
ncbi:hypothetical protein [Streptomyces sp. NPDC018693]|uniref:hypothetical protein n=1 Tax=unclassified Streptomyces TaxID=2593676 RepID=UPI0037B597FA